MMRAVLPGMRGREVWLLEGVSPNESIEGQRQPYIEDKEEEMKQGDMVVGTTVATT